MSKAVAEAVFTRWGDASLDSSIANLDPGPSQATPEETNLPRATYFLDSEEPNVNSRLRDVHTQPVMFEVWDNTSSAVHGYLDSIYDAFVNADEAGSNPLQLAAGDGHIMSVVWAGTQSPVSEDDNLFSGSIRINIQWQRARNVPS